MKRTENDPCCLIECEFCANRCRCFASLDYICTGCGQVRVLYICPDCLRKALKLIEEEKP